MKPPWFGIALVLLGLTGAGLVFIAPNELWDFLDPPPGREPAVPMPLLLTCLIVALVGAFYSGSRAPRLL